MTHGKTYNKSPRRINHKATKSKTSTGTTALERSVEKTIGGFKALLQLANFTLGPNTTLNTKIHKNSVRIMAPNSVNASKRKHKYQINHYNKQRRVLMAHSTVCQSKWKPIVEPRGAKPKTYRQAPALWLKFYEEAVIESEARTARTSRNPSQTPRGRGNIQNQTNPNRTNVRKALRLALSSPSEVIAVLKVLKNTITK